jgi:hypothetical protein
LSPRKNVDYHRDVITEEVVESTWRDSASLPPAEARRAFERLARGQPALLAFVLARSECLTREATELANYLFFVIARMFYAAAPKIRRVSIGAIEACEAEIETAMASLEGAHDNFLERAARVLSSRQPHVFRYLTEAIMEAPENESDPVALTADDQGGIFVILATVIKALDEKGLPQKAGRGEIDQSS